MDPERIHCYLQAACAGLGFDIGEVWYSPTDSDTAGNASSSSSSVQQQNAVFSYQTQPQTTSQDNQQQQQLSKYKKIKFLQLYTSKSYLSRRGDLLSPESQEDIEEYENIQKHVLSPKLVNVISNTSQVVWAHCPKQEGLLGRSDMRLQTAVGMPVAMDSDGNMCIVVMFSPKAMQKNQDAVEYLKFFRQSATSGPNTSIPCLLPVVDNTNNQNNRLVYNPKRFSDWREPSDRRKDSISESPQQQKQNSGDGMSMQNELSSAPKDPYGIPKLPSTAELGALNGSERRLSEDSNDTANAFDNVTYGVWNTIMNLSHEEDETNFSIITGTTTGNPSTPSDTNTNMITRQNEEDDLIFQPERWERLQDFVTAFLGMSVFDLADIWIPISVGIGSKMKLKHVCSMSATDSNEHLNHLKRMSKGCLIETWSGATGRAFASGNPLWGANQEMMLDTERFEILSQCNIKTVLSIPIFSPGNVSPSGVLSFYSLIRSDHVSFVLKFVQQALRTLWTGLENVEPDNKLNKKEWNRVGPADLAEMAADLEMQTAFYKKKRTFGDISRKQETTGEQDLAINDTRLRSSSLSMQLQSLNMPTGEPSFSFPLLAPAIITQEQQQQLTIQSQNPDRESKRAHVEKAHHGDNTIITASTIPQPTPINNFYVQTAVQSAPIEVTPATTSSSVHQVQHQQTSPLNTYYAGPSVTPAHVGIVANTTITPTVQQSNLQSVPAEITSTTTTGQQSFEPDKQNTNISQTNTASTSTVPKEDRSVSMEYIDAINALVKRNEQNLNQNHNIGISTNSGIYPNVGVIPPPQKNTEPLAAKGLNTHLTAFPDMPQSAVFNTGIVQPTNFNPYIPMQQQQSQPIHPQQQQPQQLQHEPSIPINPLAGPFCMDVGSNTASAPAAPAPPKPGGKVCRIEGCDDFTVSRRPYCLRHSGNRQCEHPDCSKCAQGATRFCIAHGGGRRCTFPGCDKGARDKFYCAAHGGGKRCKTEGCTKSAVGGSNLCTSHGGGRRCAIDGCMKSAQSSTKFCVKHGGGKKCSHPDCDKVARGRTLFCAGHGGGVRCKLAGCSRIAIGKKQLCRSHGGGAKQTKSQFQKSQTPPSGSPGNSSPGIST